MANRQLATEPLRPLGASGLEVSAVALGCWPIAGVTTLDANDRDSIDTIRKALDCGINFLDTAFVYGREGESERLIGEAIAGRRAEVVLATKGGIHFEGDDMVADGRPETLRGECEQSLSRMGIEELDLLYLHNPDPKLPIEESAGELQRLQAAGKTRAVGLSNCSLDQAKAFHAVCPLAAVQLPYNMLQRDIEQRTLPWCRENGIALTAYWPFMKGLLAGKIGRNDELQPGDSRLKYPMYQGEERRRNHDFVDQLREAAALSGHTVAQLVVNWTMNQPGVTAALCGAKRPQQIAETAGALGWRLSEEQLELIDWAFDARGDAAAKRVFT